MDLSRRALLVEYGPYGPSLRGLSVSLSRSRIGQLPFGLDPKKEKERLEGAIRRRDRLRELAREWVIARGGESLAGSSGPSRGRPL